MECRVLHQMNDYDNVTKSFMQNIFKSGLLVDEHHEALQNYWHPSSSSKKPHGLRSFRFIPKSVELSTSVLQCLTGDKSSLVSLGIIIPASLHYLILKLKKAEEFKYTEAFDKLVVKLHRIYELIKTVDQQHQNRLTSMENLNPNIMRALLRVVVPKMNTYLYTTGKDIIDVATKINDSIKKIDVALCTGELRNFYDVAFEQIDFSLPNLPPEDAYKAFYDRCSLSYSLIVSSFLCAIGVAFCCPRANTVHINRKKLLDEILPEALEFVCTSLKKMSEDFKGAYGALPDPSVDLHSQQVASKYRPINKTLIDFIRKIRLIFDIAQTMHDNLRQTEYVNLGYTLEGCYGDLDKLFFDSQDMLNSLKRNVCRQVKIEHAEAARRREQMARTEAAAAIGEQSISESAGPSVIRHDDPNTPASAEEYNLSVHGSDDESEHEKPSTPKYTELLDRIERQKLMIQELNTELKKRKFITQEEESTSQNKIPTARVLPIKQPADQRRNARAAAAAAPAGPNNTGQFNGANLINEPLIGLPPPQHNNYLTTFHQTFPQPNFPEQIALPFPPHLLPQQIVLLGPTNGQPVQPLPPPIQPPPPPPMPNIYNNYNFEELMGYGAYNGDMAAQIQAAVLNNNWAGNEEIYENEPLEEFDQNGQNVDNPQDNEPPPPNDEHFPANDQ